jgi:hypothetical protein
MIGVSTRRDAGNTIGCGLLEDLIHRHPADFVEAVEQLAQRE